MAAHLSDEPTLRHLIHRLREPDDFDVAVSGASLRADFLAPQSLPAVVEQFQSAAWALDFHEAHVKARLLGALPHAWASIALICSPSDSSWYGIPSSRGTLVCTPPGEPIDGRITPGFRSLAVGVPPWLWERCRTLAGVERSAFGSGRAIHLPAETFHRLESELSLLKILLRGTDGGTVRSREVMHDVSTLVTHIMTLAWELTSRTGQFKASVLNRARLARRAEDWMRAHLGEAAQVPDVCEAMGVSRRELEYAFRVTWDQSPREFLHALRLNAIRRELQRGGQGEETVIRVALDHGVRHLSRFAASYRALFGERPSETLHR